MTVETIPLANLLLSFVPAVVVVLLMWRWRINYGQAVYAIARMLLQLLLIGYVLVFIFETESSAVIVATLSFMMLAASWVALYTIPTNRATFFGASLLAILVGGGLTLVLITQAVLQLDPWYRPSFMIPLAGMIFAASMTSISIALERLHAEVENGREYHDARTTAFRASMIPVINSLFAVGLISLPGMMTGQILSGVSPLVAVRYQIMVMCMIFGAAGISTVLFLWLIDASKLRRG